MLASAATLSRASAIGTGPEGGDIVLVGPAGKEDLSNGAELTLEVVAPVEVTCG